MFASYWSTCYLNNEMLTLVVHAGYEGSDSVAKSGYARFVCNDCCLKKRLSFLPTNLEYLFNSNYLDACTSENVKNRIVFFRHSLDN